MTPEEIQIRTMTTVQLIAYHNILVNFKIAAMKVTDDPAKVDRHLEIVNRILEVKPADALKRLKLPPKEFKVAAHSDNRNSFGLTGLVLVARDGEVWQVAANDLNKAPIGTVLTVPYNDSTPAWETFGFEIPARRNNANAEIINAVWAK